MRKSSWSNLKVQLNSSSLHQHIRKILLEHPNFKLMHIYQEVPLKDLVVGYEDNHRFDFYIQELDLVIEVHGNQHYKFTNRGNQSYSVAQQNYKEQKARDWSKRRAAIDHHYRYVEIPYKDVKTLNVDNFYNYVRTNWQERE